MHSTNIGASALALLAALVAPILAQESSYFVMYSKPPVVVERVDSLLSPGKVSNHMHSVIGGNAFAPTMDFAQTQQATCGTVSVKADKSNYWMPSLYYRSPHNGSFHRAPESGYTRIYYKFGTGGNGVDLERSEFPKEFRMITGNAMLRSDDGSMGSPGNQLNWMCHNGNGNPRATGFPAFTDCDDMGLAATIRFPSCWNGQDFDSAHPQAHMAFPINQDGMAGCLAPFNVKRFPEIMIEYWVDISQFTGDYGLNDDAFVLAPGDPTGYAFHADFINGWQPGVLQAAMKTCRIGNTAEPLDTPSCFGVGGTYTDDEMKACSGSVKDVVPEDTGSSNYIKTLPGCNPVQSGPALATIQTDCPNVVTTFGDGGDLGSSSGGSGASPVETGTTSVKATTMATSTKATPTTSKQATTTSAAPSPSETSTSGDTTSGGPSSVTAADGSTWVSAGCYVDTVNPRTLPSNGWWGNPITNAECAKGCSKNGFSISGAENGGQCFCGNDLGSATKAASGDCNSACDGDSSQKCGGPARLSVYKKTSGSSKKSRAHRHREHLRRHQEAVS